MTRRILWVAAAALWIVTPSASAQTSDPATTLAGAVKATITPAALDRHAREITRWPRPSGSPGENAATDYVVATLRAEGVDVEVHEFMAYTSNPVSAEVAVPGTDFAPDAITMSFSGATDGIEAPLVDAGTLDDLPELEMGTGERLAVLDAERFSHLRGKIVLVTGQPRNVPTAALQELGAVAVVYVNPEERLNDLIVTSTWGTPSLLNYQRLDILPTAQIRRSDGDRLRVMMRAGEVLVRVRTVVDTGWRPLRLAVARVMPADATPATPYVLFGGHIDAWYHGGTDEGASNAAMLELALAFNAHRDQMKRGLLVAWWPGHSNARYGGSTWFADHFFEELRARGIAYVNVDGIGQKDAKRFGVSTSPALAALATGVVERVAGQPVRNGRPGRNSDQSFNGIGLPLLQINHSRLEEDGGYWWWHTPDDTYDKIDADILKTDTDLYADALAGLTGAFVPPLDLMAETEALLRALERRQEESGGALDLGEVMQATARLAAAVARVGGAVQQGTVPAEFEPMLYDILRPIHRIMFVPGSDHHPDPGVYGAPLPGLEPASILAMEDPTSDRYRFAQAYLQRERNRVLEGVNESVAAAGRFLDQQGIRW
ncbi:MAG TPA: M28 family peptidase [Longimicrobiales bacterium]|nr:M28 family peptidase [Longimicrobiales bacterium]